jgi:hypothetical protein
MAAIHIRTDVPGPESRRLMARRSAAVPRGVAHATPVFAASAEGARVTDIDGNVFLDFAGGIGVMNVGHSDHAVVAAIREQAAKFTHTCFSVAPHADYITVAERLAELTPGGFAKKTLLVNSGAEAIENAVKSAPCDRPPGRHLLRGRVSRPHDVRAVDDEQGDAVQGGVRGLGGRCAPGSVRVLLSLHVSADVSHVRVRLCGGTGGVVPAPRGRGVDRRHRRGAGTR